MEWVTHNWMFIAAVLYAALSEIIGASPLQSNTVVGLIMRVLQAALPTGAGVKRLMVVCALGTSLVMVGGSKAYALSIGIVDCTSVGSWADHFGKKLFQLVRLSVESSAGDVWRLYASGSIKTDDIGGDVGLLLGVFSAHINPVAAIEAAGALVCIGDVDAEKAAIEEAAQAEPGSPIGIE